MTPRKGTVGWLIQELRQFPPNCAVAAEWGGQGVAVVAVTSNLVEADLPRKYAHERPGDFAIITVTDPPPKGAPHE